MAGVGKPGPAPMLDLRDYIAPDDGAYFALVRDLVAAGCPRSRAWAIVEALRRLDETGDDGLVYSRRSDYRRELLKLGVPPWDDQAKTWSDISVRARNVNIKGRPGPRRSGWKTAKVSGPILVNLAA